MAPNKRLFEMIYANFTLRTDGFHAQLLQFSSGGGPRCLTAPKLALSFQAGGGRYLYLHG